MSVKTDIVNNLITEIKNAFPEFRKVERGLLSLEDKAISYPVCVINSIRTVINREQTTYNRTVKTMYMYVDIINKTRSNYFSSLDDFEVRMINLIDKLDYEKKLHSNVTTIEIEESSEIINDEYLDGAYLLRLTIQINYFE